MLVLYSCDAKLSPKMILIYAFFHFSSGSVFVFCRIYYYGKLGWFRSSQVLAALQIGYTELGKQDKLKFIIDWGLTQIKGI